MPTLDPPSTKAPSDAQNWSLFLLLAVIWGSSFLFITLALEEGVAPITMVSQRTLWGGLLLGVVLLWQRGRLPLRWRVWAPMLFLAIFNIVIPFTLIAWGQQYIPSGMASIFNGTVPLFTIVLAAMVLHDEALSPARTGGLAVGFLGVVLLSAPSVDAARGDEDAILALLGMAAVTGAAFCYAIAAVYARRRLTGRAFIERPDGSMRTPTAVEIAFGSTAAAFVIITALAVLFERPSGGGYALPETGLAWFSMLWLGLLGTGVAYLIFYALIARWGATRTTVVTYVIPVIAIALGFMLLDERLRPIELLGAALVIGGVVLVNARSSRSSTAQPAEGGTEP